MFERMGRRRYVVPVLIVIAFACMFSLMFWPMTHMEVRGLPFAIVSLDEGMETPTGEVNIGDTLVESLISSSDEESDDEDATSDMIAWTQLSSEEELTEALDNVDYYGALVIPKDYTSATMAAQTSAAQSGTGAVSTEDIQSLLGSGDIDASQLEALAGSGSLSADEIEALSASGTLSADQLEALAASGTLSADELQELAASGALTPDEIEALSASGSLSTEDVDALAASGTMSIDELQDLIASGNMTTDELQALAASGTISTEDLQALAASGAISADELQALAAAENAEGTQLEVAEDVEAPSLTMIIDNAKSPMVANMLSSSIATMFSEMGADVDVQIIHDGSDTSEDANEEGEGEDEEGASFSMTNMYGTMMGQQLAIMPICMTSMMACIMLTRIFNRRKSVSKSEGRKAVGKQIIYALCLSLGISIVALLMVCGITGAEVPLIEAGVFLWIAAFCMMLLYLGLFNIATWLGGIVAACIMVLGMMTGILPAEMLPSFWSDWIYPWVPQHFIGDGFRLIEYAGGGIINRDTLPIIIYGIVGAICAIISLFMPVKGKRDEIEEAPEETPKEIHPKHSAPIPDATPAA